MDYPWYSLLKNEEGVTQGDIIKNCPVARLVTNTEIITPGDNIKASIDYMDGVVVTQACDIANNKVKDIILCNIIRLSEYKNDCLNKGMSEKNFDNSIQSILKGQQYAFHLLNNYRSNEFADDYYIVSFKDVFSVPLDILKNVALTNGYRLRLNTPYREHLAQAFARFFMRIGLPQNIVLSM